MNLKKRQDLLPAVADTAARAAGSSAAKPTVPLGKASISRLIVRGNPEMDREMVDHLTSENINSLLCNCERSGVNTWQSRAEKHIIRMLHEYRQEGGATSTGSPRPPPKPPTPRATSATS